MKVFDGAKIRALRKDAGLTSKPKWLCLRQMASVDGHYTVTIGAYGKFLVTKEQYDSLKVGDVAPDYLTQGGS